MFGKKGERKLAQTDGAVFDYDLSDDLVYCQQLAMIFVFARSSSRLELRDLLAGLYVASLEVDRLTQYWPDWSKFETFVLRKCGVEGTRESNREKWEAQIRNAPVARRLFGRFFYYRLSKNSYVWRRFWNSPDVEKIYRAACEVATSANAEAKVRRPILTPEHILLAIAQETEMPLTRALLETGVDRARLEREIRKIQQPS